MARAYNKGRRSIRLPQFDYSQSGNYFVTICSAGKRHIFGEVCNGRMVLNLAGEVVRSAWFDLPQRFPSVEPRELVVMPNHIHAILGLTQPIRAAAASRGAASSAPTAEKPVLIYPTLGEIIRAFKSLSAIEVNRILDRQGQPVWQRNYYERVLRSEKEFHQARQYILENPIRWELDAENV